MRIKYQRGTVYVRGTKPQMWYGRFLLYQRDKDGKEVRKQRNVPICPKAGVPKTRAAQMLEQIILKESTVPGKPAALPSDESVTFAWFVRQRFVPMREGRWSPAYRQTNGYALEHYLISRFGDLPLRELSTFEIQVYLNQLAEKYSKSVVHQAFTNVRAILHLARKQKYVVEDPAEDVALPLTMPVEKPLMSRDQILALLGAVEDLHDLCLLYVGILCGPRASEVFGLQWKSWNGESLMPLGTAYEGQLLSWAAEDQGQQGTDSGAGAGEAGDRGMEAFHFGLLSRGANVSHLQTAPPQGTDRSARQQELPARTDSAHRPRAWHPGSSDHLPGNAANDGNRHAASRYAQGHAGRAAPCQYQHDRQCLRAGHRRERVQGCQLAHKRGSGWVDATCRTDGTHGPSTQENRGENAVQ